MPRPVPLYSIVAGIFYALCFPKFNLGMVFTWIWPLALYAALENSKNRKQAYLSVFIFSFVAYGIILYWIPVTIWTWSQNLLATVGGWLILIAYISAVTGFFGPLARKFLSSPTTSSLYPIPYSLYPLLALPSAWVLVEFIRSSSYSLLGGFPWCLAGHGFVSQTYFAQLAEIGSVWILSFFVIFTSLAFWLWLKTKKLGFIATGATAILLVFIWGALRYHSLAAKLVPSQKVAILQGNIFQYEKWDLQKADKIIEIYNQLVQQASLENPELIIWPETSYPFVISESDLLRTNLSSLKIREIKGYQLIGAVTVQNNNFRNSALLFKDSNLASIYDKVHLVPFGEFVPWRSLFSRWVNVVNQLGEISPGKMPLPLDVGIKLGITICYEAIFPELTKKLETRGAQVLINLTNDGWYLDTAGPPQHFLMNRLRTIETRLPLIRAANTGISAIINPLGVIRQQSKLSTRTLIMAQAESLPKGHSKILSVTQKFFPLFCFCLLSLSGVLKWKKLGKRRNL